MGDPAILPVADTLKIGFQFDGESGTKTGANLEDLLTRATLTNGSELLDDVTLETVLDGTIYKAQIKDDGVTTDKITDAHVTPPKLGPKPRLLVSYGGVGPQTIPYNAQTVLQLDTAGYEDPAWDGGNYRWVPDEAGAYLVHAQIRWKEAVHLKYHYGRIRKNGSSICFATFERDSTTKDVTQHVGPVLVEMNGTTDYLDVTAEHNVVVGQALREQTTSTFLCAWFLCTV